jgi:hypothetical protein
VKNLLTACVFFLAGVALLQIVPGVDLVPGGVRAALEEVDSIWGRLP